MDGAELGIDLQGILKRSIAILLLRLKSDSLTELDMGGPLLFTTLFSAVHLLVRHHLALPAALGANLPCLRNYTLHHKACSALAEVAHYLGQALLQGLSKILQLLQVIRGVVSAC